MLVFATEDQLSSWTGAPSPLNASILLREASILVRDACKADVFDILRTGCLRMTTSVRPCMTPPARRPRSGRQPTSTRRQALARLAREVVSSGIDGASVAYNTASTDAAKRHRSAPCARRRTQSSAARASPRRRAVMTDIDSTCGRHADALTATLGEHHPDRAPLGGQVDAIEHTARWRRKALGSDDRSARALVALAGHGRTPRGRRRGRARVLIARGRRWPHLRETQEGARTGWARR